MSRPRKEKVAPSTEPAIPTEVNFQPYRTYAIGVHRLAGFMVGKYKVECELCKTISSVGGNEYWLDAAEYFVNTGWSVIEIYGGHSVSCKDCKWKGVSIV
jgi:hypothetical protein